MQLSGLNKQTALVFEVGDAGTPETISPSLPPR